MKIIGTGSAHPSCSVSNEMLEKFLETTDEWITERTGIKERCVISSEKLEDLAIIAANKALEDAGLTAKDIDFIIAFTNRMANAVRCPVSREIPDNMKEKLDIYLARKRDKK